VINKGLIFDGLVFATYRDRSLYIRTVIRDRPQWLKDHPEVWETIENAERKDARRLTAQEIRGEPSGIGPSSPAGADPQNDSSDTAEVDDVRLEDLSPSDRLSLPKTASPAIAPSAPSSIGDEVTINGQRYVSAEQLAAILGISLRTLSRWCKKRGSPSKIKVGSKVFFAADAIPEWKARRQTATAEDRDKKEVS
jgi:predicted DNA-binding transcriptional regulator AlpA